MKVFAIITAGGSGTRMNTDKRKQYIDIGNKPVLAHTINKFQVTAGIDGIFLTAPQEDIDYVRSNIVQKYNFSRVEDIFPGGNTRQDSVFEALKNIKAETDDIILIHDGVRPFISHEIITECVNSLTSCDCSVTGIRPVNTIKSVSEGKIQSTLDRDQLVSVQTPQTFKYGFILKCHEAAKRNKTTATDDSALAEKYGKEILGRKPLIKVVAGSSFNIKITAPGDLVLAAALLEHLSV